VLLAETRMVLTYEKITAIKEGKGTTGSLEEKVQRAQVNPVTWRGNKKRVPIPTEKVQGSGTGGKVKCHLPSAALYPYAELKAWGWDSLRGKHT